jgi:CP family cyanate transporter-like MFS transporter
MRPASILAGLFFIALTLRPQIVGVGPLLPDIQDSLNTTHAVAGLLATIPVLCMGLFAPPAAYLSSRVGTRSAITFSVLLIGVFGVARAVAPSAALVVLFTWPVGIGMGVAGAVVPVAVKERFAARRRAPWGSWRSGADRGDRGW